MCYFMLDYKCCLAWISNSSETARPVHPNRPPEGTKCYMAHQGHTGHDMEGKLCNLPRGVGVRWVCTVGWDSEAADAGPAHKTAYRRGYRLGNTPETGFSTTDRAWGVEGGIMLNLMYPHHYSIQIKRLIFIKIAPPFVVLKFGPVW